MPVLVDERTKKRRWYHKWQDPHTMVSRWPHGGHDGHKNSTLICNFGNVLTCQRFCQHFRSCCRTFKNSAGGHAIALYALANVSNLQKLNRSSYDSLIWTRECLKFVPDQSRWRKMSLIVCPSRGKLRIGWRGYNVLQNENINETRIEPVGEPYREVCLSPWKGNWRMS